MTYKCDPCDCPIQHYNDGAAWHKAMITLLCDIEAAIVNLSPGQGIWQRVATVISPLAAGDSLSVESLTLSTFTTGAIPFIGTAGLVTYNSSQLFWDTASHYLGIGTDVPDNPVDIWCNAQVGLGLYRTSSGANPIGISFDLRDSNGDRSTYATVSAAITTNTAGAEDGHLRFYTKAAGSLAEKARLTKDGYLGLGTTAPATRLDIKGDEQVSSSVSNSLGGYVRKFVEATATMAGASTTITLNVPTGARLLGTQLRVDTLITSGDGGTTWSAAYSGGSALTIASTQVFTKNTKVNTMAAGVPITTAGTNITISCDGGKTFSAGVVRAITYYEDFTAMGNNP